MPLTGGRRGRRRHQGVDALPVLVPVTAEHDGAQLAVPSEALEAVHVVPVQVLPELPEEVSEEARVGDDRDALLRSLVQPLEELDCALAAVLVGLPLVRVEHVVVVHELGEVEVRELGRYLAYGPASVAHVVPPPLAALLPNEEAGGCDLHPRVALGRTHRRVHEAEERRLPRLAGRAEDVQSRLARAGEGGNDDEVERSEGPRAGRALGEVGLERFRLRDALGGEAGVVQRMIRRGPVAAEEAVVVPGLLRRDVVVPLRRCAVCGSGVEWSASRKVR